MLHRPSPSIPPFCRKDAPPRRLVGVARRCAARVRPGGARAGACVGGEPRRFRAVDERHRHGLGRRRAAQRPRRPPRGLRRRHRARRRGAPTVVGGANVFFLTVYANTGGEPVTFKAYDAAANVVRDLSATLTFAANAVAGSVPSPFALAPGTSGGGGGSSTPEDPWRVNAVEFLAVDEPRRRGSVQQRRRRGRVGCRGRVRRERGARRGDARRRWAGGACSSSPPTPTPTARRSPSRSPPAAPCAISVGRRRSPPMPSSARS